MAAKKPAAEITAYVKPTCTTCRKSLDLLEKGGAKVTTVDLFATPLDEAALRGLLRKLGLRPRDVLRSRDAAYEELGLASGAHGDDELIALMVAHPGLIQRPILVRGKRAVLARPAEKTSEILD